MDIQASTQSKPQWRFERPHRVRLHSYRLHINEVININFQDMYMKAAEEFSKTDRYQWAERNGVKLDFDIDNNTIDWFKQVRFYADLSESEYTDYCLRFFNHHNEDWK